MFKLHLDAMCLGNILAVQMAISYRLLLALWLSFEYSKIHEEELAIIRVILAWFSADMVNK